MNRFTCSPPWGVLSLLVAALTAGACSTAAPAEPSSATASPAASTPSGAVSVTSIAAVERDVPVLIRATGSFVADESSDVTPAVAGQVVATLVNVGDTVMAGQPLVRLDERDAQLRLSQARASLLQAEAQANNARAEAERNASLAKHGDVSRVSYERLQLQVTTAEAALAQGRVQVEVAQKALDDTTVRAPFAGHVSARAVSVGESVSPGSKVATIVRIHPIRLELQIPESATAQLKVGMAVDAEVPAYPGVTFHGNISALNVAIDPASRAMTVEAKFPNTPVRLTPGMFGTAGIHLMNRERAVYVPADAVITVPGSESSGVYVLDGSSARIRVVQVAPAGENMVRVLSGLEPGAVVATSNLGALFDGAAITSRPAAGAPAGALALKVAR